MKLTLKQKAQKANGKSRLCENCRFRQIPFCTPTTIEICSQSFIDGYQKGYKQAMRELKQKRRFVMDVINEIMSNNQMNYTKNDVVELLETHLEESYINGKSWLAKFVIMNCMPSLTDEDRQLIIELLKGE